MASEATVNLATRRCRSLEHGKTGVQCSLREGHEGWHMNDYGDPAPIWPKGLINGVSSQKRSSGDGE